jgi:SPP1 family predicted phage head-tail adaptor
MQAGDLDRRLVFQRATTIRDEYNEEVETWVDLAKVWARRRDVSDGEKEAAGQVGSVLVSRFTIRSNPTSRGFRPVDRIRYDGAKWNIQGIKEADEGRNRFLEITAVRDADHGEDDSQG